METGIDFLECLDTDVRLNILIWLDDPADLVRASAVSRFWRDFVIANGLSKQLCLKKFRQLSITSHIIEPNPLELNTGTSNAIEMEILERDHNAYASLLQALYVSKVFPKDCIADAVSASSTDRYPDENIANTLNPWSRSRWGSASYWSSKGHSDPNISETLIYRMKSDISIVTEIYVRPFQEYREQHHPIYSAESVRFRMGHLKSQNLQLCHPDDNNFVWAYTSPTFPMKKENHLQQFKLPEPVLCIGGFLQIELLGSVQKAELDGLFYICICYVQAIGLPLKPAFDIEILEPSGKFMLKYHPESINSILEHSSNDKNSGARKRLSSLEIRAGRLW